MEVWEEEEETLIYVFFQRVVWLEPIIWKTTASAKPPIGDCSSH